MKKVRQYLSLIITVSMLIACDDDTDFKPDTEPSVSASLIVPFRVLANHLLPVAMETVGDIRMESVQNLSISASPAHIQGDVLTLKRGRGSVLLTTSDSGTAVIRAEGSSISPQETTVTILENPVMRTLSGDLSGENLLWDSTSVILIESNVRVPRIFSLVIQPGAIILLGSMAEILIEGAVVCGGNGSSVLFMPADPTQPWGEIEHLPGSSAEYRNSFFVGGGGNPARVFGHSGSQPVLGGWQCSLTADHVVIMDCPGKAFGLSQSEAQISHSLITRCDTGGEFTESLVEISYSHILDIPDADFLIDDDDNDGLHLIDPWIGGDQLSRVYHCVFMTGEDDAIDHHNANLRIEDCVIQEYFHEGIAASSGHRAEIYNTLVMDCEQGIEAGFGSPEVWVTHCTLINNKIGLRLGDSYALEDLGSLSVFYSVIAESDSLNVWNYDLTIQGPREGAIDISFSIVNQDEYDQGFGCLTGTPVFDSNFELTPESVGYHAAPDTSSMGLLPLQP